MNNIVMRIKLKVIIEKRISDINIYIYMCALYTEWISMTVHKEKRISDINMYISMCALYTERSPHDKYTMLVMTKKRLWKTKHLKFNRIVKKMDEKHIL